MSDTPASPSSASASSYNPATPSKRQRPIDYALLRRKCSRAALKVLTDLGKIGAKPVEIRLQMTEDCSKVKPTVLYTYDPVTDADQE